MSEKPDVIFIILGSGFNRYVEKLTKGLHDFYHDSNGTVWALRFDNTLVDTDPRCGDGLFSLPKSSRLNDACRSHDYRFSSNVYRFYYTFEDANAALERDLKSIGASNFIAKTFRLITDSFIGRYVWNRGKNRFT